MKIHKLVIFLSKSHLNMQVFFNTSIRSQCTFSVVTFPQHTLLNIGPDLAFKLFVMSRPVGSPLQNRFLLNTKKKNTFSNKFKKLFAFHIYCSFIDSSHTLYHEVIYHLFLPWSSKLNFTSTSWLLHGPWKADYQRYYLPDSCHFFLCRYGHTFSAERALVYSRELKLAMPC